MKYKVSLLPEKNRKRIIGKKKAEKGRGIANVALLILLGVALISLVCKVVADGQLSEIQRKNAEYEQKVSSLQQYRDINNTLQAKLTLIENVQINEPSLYNFVTRLGNVSRPGISVTNIEMLDWKTSRICNVTGSATSREAFNVYLEKLTKLDGVQSATCTSYVVEVAEGEAVATFSVSIACEGGAVPITTAAPDTTAATTAAE